MGDADVILASASPRRLHLLQQIGIRALVRPAEIDETLRTEEPPETFVCRLATEKAMKVFRESKTEKFPVLAADTIVVLQGQIFGKPESRQHSREMLTQLSAQTHRVLTAVTLVGDFEQTILSESQVTMRAIVSEEIDAYWATGEPRDKAGAYGIQGLGALFVQNITGSYSGVMGLPLYETAQLLAKEQIHCLLRSKRNCGQ